MFVPSKKVPFSSQTTSRHPGKTQRLSIPVAALYPGLNAMGLKLDLFPSELCLVATDFLGGPKVSVLYTSLRRIDVF